MILTGAVLVIIQAIVVISAGVAFDSTIVSAIIAGIFVIVNQVLTFFLQSRLYESERDREIHRSKKKGRRTPVRDNRVLRSRARGSSTERDRETWDEGE